MVSNLKEFLTQPESPRDSQVQTHGEINNQELPALDIKEVKGANPKEKFEHLKKGLDGLEALMQKAQTKFDDYARSGLEALKKAFPSQRTSIQTVKLPKELVDHYGGDANQLKFGAQTIKSEAQYEKLQRDVELAKKYFGDDIHLHKITYDNGRPPVAVVMGIDAESFNAVVSAERHRTQLENAMKATAREMMRSHTGVTQSHMENLDRAAGMVTNIDKAAQKAQSMAFSPSQGKGPSIREV